MDKYLRPTDVMDYNHPEVQDLARTLGDGISEQTTIAKRCFEWVRDEIKHSGDFKMNPTTCAASEVLRHKTGWCFAKSHLLAALLRANRIPAGLCYQRLTRNGTMPPFTLHGLNAVFLPEFGWYRIDPRGNRSGIDAQFDPPNEKLAWPIAVEGERDLRGVWADPLPSVIAVLRNRDTWDEVRNHLPDMPFQGRDIRYQAVILKDHHVLLLKIEDDGKAVWIIPGGGQEGSESEEECVIREVWEETHLRVEVERLILDEKVPQDPFYERHRTYLCQIIGGVAQPGIEPEVGDAESPIKDIGWFDLRAVDSWDALGGSPPFAFTLLKRIREKLGYARGTYSRF